MKQNLIETIYKHIDTNEFKLRRGEYFIKTSQKNSKFAFILEGITRSFVIDEKGNEVNIFFSKENDLITGKLIADSPAIVSIQALTPCILYIGNFKELIDFFKNKPELEQQYNEHLNSIHTKIQKRLISQISMTAIERYQFFLKEYSNILNRVPHYHVANFLGITPTQLSRIRKQSVINSQQM